MSAAAKKRENKTKEIELNGEQESRYSVLKAECGKKAHKLGQVNPDHLPCARRVEMQDVESCVSALNASTE